MRNEKGERRKEKYRAGQNLQHIVLSFFFLKLIVVRKEKGCFLCEGWRAALSPF